MPSFSSAPVPGRTVTRPVSSRTQLPGQPRGFALSNLFALVFLMALATSVHGQTSPGDIKAGPCDAPECHQFDFWVGDWNVFTPDGKLAGTNRVQRILGGCVIEENWEGSKGTNGMSFNMYSAADKKWHQTWVDSQGTRLDLMGGFEDGRMVLSGDTPSPSGAVLHNRITWEKMDEGHVRQHWEVSPDGEKWTDAFLGVYTAKPKVPAKPPAKGGKG